MESTVVWKDQMAFDAELEGSTFTIDADPKFGGQGLGPKPKGLLLTALAGCTAMDVIAILNKMRVSPTAFEVRVEGDLSEEHPKRFTTAVVEYRFSGNELPIARLLRAVQLSEDRYCGISATLKPSVSLSHRVYLNGQRIDVEAEETSAQQLH